MSTQTGAGRTVHTTALYFWTRSAVWTWQFNPNFFRCCRTEPFVRVGGHEPRSIATRLVSASNSDLRNQVEDGTFRLDFLFRINAVTINLPPLRQRIADLPILIDYFIDHYAKIFHNTPELLSRSAVRLMQNYHWPGNVAPVGKSDPQLLC